MNAPFCAGGGSNELLLYLFLLLFYFWPTLGAGICDATHVARGVDVAAEAA